MKTESKALFLLAVLWLHSSIGLAHLSVKEEAPNRNLQLNQLARISDDLKRNSDKLSEKLLSVIKSIKLDDPLQLAELQFPVKAPLIKLSASVPIVNVRGLSKFDTKIMKVSLMKGSIEYVMDIGEVDVDGEYSIEGKYWGSPKSAQGAFNISLKNVKITAQAKLDIEEELKITHLKFKLKYTSSRENLEDMKTEKDLKKSFSVALLETMTKSLQAQLVSTTTPVITKAVSGLNHCSLAECTLNPHIHLKYLKQSQENINDLIEEALIDLSEKIVEKGYDPATLPDFGVEWGIWIFVLKIGLFNGFLEGMSNIVRAGDWVMDSNSGITTVQGPLAVFDLKGGYTFEMSYTGVGIDVDITADISYFDIDVVIEIDTVNCVMTLQKFESVNIGEVDIEAEGLILVDWMVELILQIITDVFLELIVDIIESIVSDMVEEIVSSIDVCTKLLPAFIQEP